MNASDLCYTPATELSRLIRSKVLSPVELMEAVLARIERINPVINAYCTMTATEAMDEARRAEAMVMAGRPLGDLHGIPVSIKDLALTKGVRTMSGSFIFEHRVPDVDAPFVRRLKDAGAIMVGKTTSPEFGWKALGQSPVTGHTRNPWNTAMTPGGSSSGAAAATAAGLGPLANGSDGAGSIRIPAAFCGVYGQLHPAAGRHGAGRAHAVGLARGPADRRAPVRRPHRATGLGRLRGRAALARPPAERLEWGAPTWPPTPPRRSEAPRQSRGAPRSHAQ